MSILDHHNEDRVVLKRLKRITEERKKLDVKRATDPFRRTFLEKIRDVLGLGIDGGRQHWIKAKLHWFSGAEQRLDEITQEIDKSYKISRTMQSLNDNQGVNYAVDTLDASARFDETGKCTDEYLSLLRQETQGSNDMDFNVNKNQKVIALEGETQKVIELEGNNTDTVKRISCENKVNPELKKSTSELFLSVHNFVQDKEKDKEKHCQEIEKPKEIFAATKLWAQSNEYMPGEQWDPNEQSFEVIPDMKLEINANAQDGIMEDTTRMIGMLLAKADPNMLAMEAI